MSLDLVDALRGIGLCAPREAILSLVTHATKSRLSPAEVVEQIVTLERRERHTRNLAARTKRAMLGAMKSLDRFDGSFPRVIVQALYERPCDVRSGDLLYRLSRQRRLRRRLRRSLHTALPRDRHRRRILASARARHCRREERSSDAALTEGQAKDTPVNRLA
jgi:hypothetical protein